MDSGTMESRSIEYNSLIGNRDPLKPITLFNFWRVRADHPLKMSTNQPLESPTISSSFRNNSSHIFLLFDDIDRFYRHHNFYTWTNSV